MYFVYIPPIGGQNDRHQVLSIVQGFGVPTIDMREVFANHPDVQSLYQFRRVSLLNSEGFRLVSQEIYNHLGNKLKKIYDSGYVGFIQN